MVVANKLVTFLLLICASLLSSNMYAETEVVASVDRNELYESQLLNLTIQANSELDSGPLGGLMNFGGRQIESPKFDDLEQNWEIIDRQQSYNMRSVNGTSTSTITWRYTLSPKRSGTLTIPAASFKEAQSKPVDIQVLAGSPPRDDSNPPPVFLRAEVDKTTAYVQEQITLTLGLYTLGQIVNGDMSEPNHPDIITENLGDTTKTFRMAYGERYEVYERTYLLFPQKSGTLRLDPQSFTGTYVPTGSRRPLRAREISNAIELDIQAPPASFSGTTWLPATSLFINESLKPELAELSVGESLTRRVEVKALGLLGSALPPLPEISSPLLKVYPDKPETNSQAHSSGSEATRVETSALVAIREGETTLPEIRIPWWDTVNDVERVAVIPTKEITIMPATSSANPETDDSSTQGTASADSFNQVPTDSSENIATTQATLDSGESIAGKNSAQADNSATQANDEWYWYLIVSSLIIGWAAHVSVLMRRKPKIQSADSSSGNFGMSLKQVKDLLMQTNADASGLVCQYLRSQYNRSFSTMEQIKSIDAQLYEQLRDLENKAYGPSGANMDAAEVKAAKKEILNTLSKLKKQEKTQHDTNHLAPLYPQ